MARDGICVQINQTKPGEKTLNLRDLHGRVIEIVFAQADEAVVIVDGWSTKVVGEEVLAGSCDWRHVGGGGFAKV